MIVQRSARVTPRPAAPPSLRSGRGPVIVDILARQGGTVARDHDHDDGDALVAAEPESSAAIDGKPSHGMVRFEW